MNKMEEESSGGKEKDSGLFRVMRNQNLPLPGVENDAAVSGIALLLSGKTNELDSDHIKKIRKRYQSLRLQE